MKEIHWTNEQRKLSELKGWEKNPRQIDELGAAKLEESLAEFGQIQAIAIDPDNVIVDGHQRNRVWKASELFGRDYVVDVRVANRALTDGERKKLSVFIHKSAVGDWDFEALGNDFERDDLIDWGFSGDELAEEGIEEPESELEDLGAEVSRADELQEKWQVEVGQLWKLGEHRLICGDCTDETVVEQVMGGEKAGAVVTDPPYPDYHADKYQYKDGVIDFLNDYHLKQFVFWSAKVSFPLDYTAIHIWDKKVGVASQYERVFERNGKKNYKVFEHISPSSPVRACVGSDEYNEHPSQKPTKLMIEILEEIDESFIFEPFAGSGTTLIACERLNRKCRAIEISPPYCSVILERWSEMTGKTPELIGE